MGTRTVRVRLLPKWTTDPEEITADQMFFDVNIDDETFYPVAKAPAFGHAGPALAPSVLPVLLRTDGTLDYGDWAETQDRFHKLNLLKRRIVGGELVTFTNTTTDEEAVYQIADIT